MSTLRALVVFPLPQAVQDRFWSRVTVLAPDVCWPWIGRHSDDYGHGSIRVAPHVAWAAHRVSLVIHLGRDVSKGLYVCHARSCPWRPHRGAPVCVNPDHLYEGSHQDNVDDNVALRYHASGEVSGKLTDADVVDIISRLHSGESYAQAARGFDVGAPAVGYIARGHTWQHLPRPAGFRIDTSERKAMRGERSGKARLSNARADQIRQRFANGGVRIVDLGVEFGVAFSTIARILAGQTYPTPNMHRILPPDLYAARKDENYARSR